MRLRDYTRANDFDRVVGRLQAMNVIKLGFGNSILDIGCGIGEYTPIFLSRFERVVGLDPSQEYLNEARKTTKGVEYIKGYGETFKVKEKFGTITATAVLEHLEDPRPMLINCKKHLAYGGRIIIQVPNSESITRKLGVIMGLLPGLDHISEKERGVFGHKRTCTIQTLIKDCKDSGLEVLETGGLVWKPLPNEDLWKLYQEKGESFLRALVEFGKDRPRECASIYMVCG